MDDKSIAVFFSLAILGQAGMLRIFAGSWMVPGCIFGLFWFAFTFIPLVALWSIPVKPWGMAYIFAACTAFSLTGYAFKWKHWFHKASKAPFYDGLDTPFIKILFYATSIATTASLLIDLLIQGIAFTSIFTEPLTTAAKIIRLRYDHELQPNVFATIFIALRFPSVILGGLFYFSHNPRGMTRIFLLAMIFFPVILSMLLLGDKGSMFLAIPLFWGALLVHKIRQGDRKIFSLNEIGQLFIYGALVIFILFFVFMARMAPDINTSGLPLSEYIPLLFRSYTSAHIYAFLHWFAEITKPDPSQIYDDSLGQYGFYTFMAIAKLLSSQDIEIPHGTYSEYFHYGEIIKTNIYTIFRGLINDFGMFGSIFAMLIMGFISNLTFLSLLKYKFPAFSMTLFIHSIGFFCTSIFISLFIWNSPFFSIIFVFLFLKLNAFLLERKQRNFAGYSS